MHRTNRMTVAFVAAMAVMCLTAPAAQAQVCGDSDGNGEVTEADGINTLRAAANVTSPCTNARCDTNGDGVIDDVDGVNVLRAAAGLDATLECVSAEINDVVSEVETGEGQPPAALRVGAAPIPGAGAVDTIGAIEGSTTVVPGSSNTIKVPYDATAQTAQMAQALGVDPQQLDLKMIIAINDTDQFLQGFFEIPLDTLVGEISLTTFFPQGLGGGTFLFCPATLLGGVLSNYGALEQTPAQVSAGDLQVSLSFSPPGVDVDLALSEPAGGERISFGNNHVNHRRDAGSRLGVHRRDRQREHHLSTRQRAASRTVHGPRDVFHRLRHSSPCELDRRHQSEWGLRERRNQPDPHRVVLGIREGFRVHAKHPVHVLPLTPTLDFAREPRTRAGAGARRTTMYTPRTTPGWITLGLAVIGLLVAISPAAAQICGDADEDGRVTDTDAVLAFRRAANLPSACKVLTCDADGSGTVTENDARAILRKASGLAMVERCGRGSIAGRVLVDGTAAAPTREREPNDFASLANRLGRVSPGTTRSVAGHIAPSTDPFDGYVLLIDTPVTLDLQLRFRTAADADLLITDLTTVVALTCEGTAVGVESCQVDIDPGGDTRAMHIAVTASAESVSTDYDLTIRVSATTPGAHGLTPRRGAAPPRAIAPSIYAGHDADFIPGEMIVQSAEARTSAIPLASDGARHAPRPLRRRHRRLLGTNRRRALGRDTLHPRQCGAKPARRPQARLR